MLSAFVIPATVLGGYDRHRAVLEEHHIPTGPLPEKHHTHASTITEAADGTLLAAWFGGTAENHPDVKIWLSRKAPGAAEWAEPVVIDDGVRDGKDYPTWNPVLFTDPKSGTIYLWYKITGEGPKPGYQNWWGAVRTSADAGKSWSDRIWLPQVDTAAHPMLGPSSGHATGPVKNRPLALPDGRLLCGSSTETELGWRVHFEIYEADDWTGQKHGVTIVGPLDGKGIQPSFIVQSPDFLKLGAFTRNDGFTSSKDGGKTWSAIGPSPVKTAVGLHAVTTANGWHFLAYNETGVRTPLKLARSRDGEHWEIILPSLSADGLQSMDYPTIMQTKDGKLHIVHTYGRQFINHLVLDTKYLEGDGEAAPK